MTNKISTKPVDKMLFGNYLKKASEFLKSAERSMPDRDYNSAAANAVHCLISLVDALTTAKLGLRHSGERHEDAVKLINMVNGIGQETADRVSKKYIAALRVKNMAEYEERLVKPNDAHKIVGDAKEVYGIISVIVENRK
jgi:HEPN domain-containing protein